jgi:hypothetical protein
MGLAQDFGVFWQRYPRKVGKLAAEKAFQQVTKNGASLEDLLAGIARYVQHKPAYADWCYPVTFLRQGRWMDSYDDVIDNSQAQAEPWWEECKRLHDSRCNGQGGHHVQMRLDALRVKADA